MRKKEKKKKAKKALTPEIASAVDIVLQGLRDDDTKGETVEESLRKIGAHLGTSSEKDLAIVTALGDIRTSRTARVLQRLAQSVSNKDVLKGIRRSLYRI